MKKIASFSVDHTKLTEGVYISRVDGDVITYDLRFHKPNTGRLLDNKEIHTTEHMMATFLRNSEIADSVVYFGPMGCQTGFYLLVRDDVTPERVLSEIKRCLKLTIEYDGEVFGASEKECGNYRNLELHAAQRVCESYLEKIKPLDRIITYEEVGTEGKGA